VLTLAGLAIGLLILAWVTTRGSALGWHHAPSSPRRIPSPSDGAFKACPVGTVRSLQGKCIKVHQLQLDGVAVAIAWLLKLIGVAFIVVLTLFIYSARPQRKERGEPIPDVEEVPILPSVAEAITEDADALLAALREGSPRNAIVACWIRLEQSVERAGLQVRAGETSTELTIRSIRRYPIDRSSIVALAELYREARFSSHPITEDMRTIAIAALQQLQADLTTSAAAEAGQ
jgi:hypothetical protein